MMTIADAELPPPSDLALPILIAIPLGPPVGRPRAGGMVAILLQVAHRLGTVALLAALGTAYLLYTAHDFYVALAAATGCGIVGFSAALLALSFTHRDRPQWREAVGAGLFNAVIAVLGLAMMLVARAGVIQESVRTGGESLRGHVQEFFTAPPVVPVQP